MAINLNNFFTDAIFSLDRWGVIDVVLPFILIYTLVYAVLSKAKIWGTGFKKENTINVVISLVIGILFVVPHVLYGGRRGDGVLEGIFIGYPDPVDIINASIPSIAIWLVVLLMFMILAGFAIPLAGTDVNKWLSKHASWIAGIAATIVVYIFGVSANLWPPLKQLLGVNPFGDLLTSDTAIVVLVFLIIGLVVWYIGKDDSPKKKKPPADDKGEGD